MLYNFFVNTIQSGLGHMLVQEDIKS